MLSGRSHVSSVLKTAWEETVIDISQNKNGNKALRFTDIELKYNVVVADSHPQHILQELLELIVLSCLEGFINSLYFYLMSFLVSFHGMIGNIDLLFSSDTFMVATSRLDRCQLKGLIAETEV